LELGWRAALGGSALRSVATTLLGMHSPTGRVRTINTIIRLKTMHGNPHPDPPTPPSRRLPLARYLASKILSVQESQVAHRTGRDGERLKPGVWRDCECISINIISTSPPSSKRIQNVGCLRATCFLVVERALPAPTCCYSSTPRGGRVCQVAADGSPPPTTAPPITCAYSAAYSPSG